MDDEEYLLTVDYKIVHKGKYTFPYIRRITDAETDSGSTRSGFKNEDDPDKTDFTITKGLYRVVLNHDKRHNGYYVFWDGKTEEPEPYDSLIISEKQEKIDSLELEEKKEFEKNYDYIQELAKDFHKFSFDSRYNKLYNLISCSHAIFHEKYRGMKRLLKIFTPDNVNELRIKKDMGELIPKSELEKDCKNNCYSNPLRCEIRLNLK